VRHAIFSQQYRHGGSNVTCWWGIRDETMSFLVIDATNRPSTDAAFSLATGDSGSHGTLNAADGICCIDVIGTVLYLTEDCVGGERLPMSAAQLTTYLGGGEYALSLEGVRSFLRDDAADRPGH
jgi:hypothetical protein